MKFTSLAALCALQMTNSVVAFAPGSIHTRRLPSTSLNGGLRNLVVNAGKQSNAPSAKASSPKKSATAKAVTDVAKAETTTAGVVVPEVAATAAAIPPTTAGGDITEKEVRALFELWNSALATGDSRIVADRYIRKPVLLPTVSDVPRTDFDSVKDYFDAFLKKKPQGKYRTVRAHVHFHVRFRISFVRSFVHLHPLTFRFPRIVQRVAPSPLSR